MTSSPPTSSPLSVAPAAVPPPTALLPRPALDAAGLAELADGVGIRRIHLLAWRDLADSESGGSEVHASTVAEIWARAGLEVTMRTSYAKGHPNDSLRHGYRVIRRRGRYTVFPAAAVAERLGRHGPTDALVEIWNGVPFLSPLWANVPHITFVHHLHRHMWKLVMREDLARAGELFERRVAPRFYRSTPVVTLSRSSRDELVAEMRLRPEQVHVVPPGIDARFRPAERGPDAEREHDPTIVAVGRLTGPKRFEVLISAVDELRREPGLERLRLVIVGDGFHHDTLEQLVADLGLGEHVRMAGRVSDDELVSLYRRAWVVASASIAEGWGMTLTEAAACGTPAVATRIAGHLDSVHDGHSGLLATDERELVGHLRTVLTDPARRDELARGALAHAATFSWQATATGALEILAAQARRRAARRGAAR